MFAYNPQVQDQSGQILGQYQTQAAKTQAESQAALGQNIGKGLESIGSSVAGGITKSRENAIKYDTAAGMLETYKQNAGALGLDLNMLGGMEEKYAKDPDKLIGALTVVGKMAENNMGIEKAQKTYEALGNSYSQKAAAAQAVKDAQPDKMNAATIRSYAADAAQQGKSAEQIKDGLLRYYGQWAVDAVFPQPKTNFWGP